MLHFVFTDCQPQPSTSSSGTDTSARQADTPELGEGASADIRIDATTTNTGID